MTAHILQFNLKKYLILNQISLQVKLKYAYNYQLKNDPCSDYPSEHFIAHAYKYSKEFHYGLHATFHFELSLNHMTISTL